MNAAPAGVFIVYTKWIDECCPNPKESDNMAFQGIASCTTLRHTIIRRATAAHRGQRYYKPR